MRPGNRDDQYLLIPGTFILNYLDRPVEENPETDGDTVKFAPDRDVWWLPDVRRGARWWEAGRAESVRLDGIDALELHYGGSIRRHQRIDLALAARDRLLSALGFGRISFHTGSKNQFRTDRVEHHPARGHILAKGFDNNRRVVGLVYTGAPRFATPSLAGGWVDVDESMLDASVNALLVRESLAYVSLYDSMPARLRDHLRALGQDTRERGLGIWQHDALWENRGVTASTASELEDLVMLPKIFRRLVDYFADGHIGLDQFDAWLRAPGDSQQNNQGVAPAPSGRDDVVHLPSGELGRLRNALSIEQHRLRLRYPPESLTFVDRKH